MGSLRETQVCYNTSKLTHPEGKVTHSPDVRPSILHAIGGTPLVRLNRLVPPNSANVLVKLEYYNPTGSYKDRKALSIIEEAEKRGELRPGMTVVEFTGGSTGSSLALVCSIKGYHLKLVSSDAFAREKLATMRALGADLQIVPSVGGKVTPDLLPRMRSMALEIAAQPDTYYVDQFNNPDALVGYEKLGEELVAQTDTPIDVYCGGVGTAGMLMGVSRALRRRSPNTKIIALEPATSPMLTTGVAGAHRVEGVAMGIIPPHLNRDHYHEARTVTEEDARATARRLAREEGIFAGISSGLNVAAALQIARELGPGHTVATVAVDTGLKYLAGDLYAE